MASSDKPGFWPAELYSVAVVQFSYNIMVSSYLGGEMATKVNANRTSAMMISHVGAILLCSIITFISRRREKGTTISRATGAILAVVLPTLVWIAYMGAELSQTETKAVSSGKKPKREGMPLTLFSSIVASLILFLLMYVMEEFQRSRFQEFLKERKQDGDVVDVKEAKKVLLQNRVYAALLGLFDVLLAAEFSRSAKHYRSRVVYVTFAFILLSLFQYAPVMQKMQEDKRKRFQLFLSNNFKDLVLGLLCVVLIWKFGLSSSKLILLAKSSSLVLYRYIEQAKEEEGSEGEVIEERSEKVIEERPEKVIEERSEKVIGEGSRATGPGGLNGIPEEKPEEEKKED
ncbi:Hypp6395 [Branchiostoma lanceolatum]|uniref:Hypp6395 protein n=1 Tax=Branchiostoma lanceolatum TaxID=7740 RepID=A0A8J9YTZ9_BRALA|nr:Hypp6395 [Branchiostoma lanceolatum]